MTAQIPYTDRDRQVHQARLTVSRRRTYVLASWVHPPLCVGAPALVSIAVVGEPAVMNASTFYA